MCNGRVEMCIERVRPKYPAFLAWNYESIGLQLQASVLHHVPNGVSHYLHGPQAAAPLYWCWGFGAKFCEYEMVLLQGSETSLKQV